MVDGLNADIAASLPLIDDEGELQLHVRRELLFKVGVPLSDHQRMVFLVQLGLTCSRRSWSIWRAMFPTEEEPMDLAAALVSMAVQGEVTVRANVAKLGELKTHLEDKFLLGEHYFPAVYAGFACWAVARDVIYKRRLGPVVGGASESHIPPDEWDPCYLSSLAISGGATWEERGDSRARRQFWEWYLQSAIPEAYAMARTR